MSLMARVLLLVAIALSPAILIQAYNEFAFRSERERQIATVALQHAQLVNADLGSIIGGAHQLAVALASTERVRRLDPTCVEELRLVHVALSGYKDLTVFDAGEHAVCSTLAAPLEQIPISDAPRSALRTGAFSIGHFQRGTISGRSFLPVAYPFRDDNGAIRGAVTLSFDLGWLGRHVGELELPANSTVSITDTDGTVLARFPEHDKWVGTKFRIWGPELVNSDKPGTGLSRGFDGKERIVGYVPTGVSPKGLFVGVGLYAPDLMADIDAAFWRGAGLIAVAAALAMTAAVVMGRRFIRQPSQWLVEAAGRWQQGDFAARAPGRSKGSEFARLGVAFNAMAEALEQRERRLAQITADLEHQVAARTRELNASEARYRSYFEASPDCLFDVEIAAEGGFRFAALNQAAERILAIDGRQCAGKSPHDLFPTAIADRLVARFRECIADGAIVRFAGPLPSAEGAPAFDVAIVPVRDDSGHIVRLLGAARDITERNKLEEQLRQVQKLEAVGQLTGGIAHDFNNLLTACLGNLELLRPQLPEPTQIRLLDGAVRAAERGARLTEQLLAFSRRQHHAPEPIDGNALVHGMETIIERAVTPSVRIEKVLAANLWPMHADKNQVEVAILNLVLNARDAMPLGGTLTIETANLSAGHPRLPRELEGDFVLIAVSDNGTGMDEEVQARLFEPFFTTKPPGKGTGLGLSMVYGMAKQAGGAVLVSSQRGQGTTVSLILPRSRAVVRVEPAPEPAPSAMPPGTKRVLVVDDDRPVREFTAELLHEQGHHVSQRENGWAALDALEGAAFDLLIVDYAMPAMNGGEVARRARALREGLPIVLVTGYISGSLGELPEGVALLKKPFRRQDLAAAIEQALAWSTRPAASNVVRLHPG